MLESKMINVQPYYNIDYTMVRLSNVRYLSTRATALVVKFLHIWTPNRDIFDDIQR